jgi:hypothetical protein
MEVAADVQMARWTDIHIFSFKMFLGPDATKLMMALQGRIVCAKCQQVHRGRTREH